MKRTTQIQATLHISFVAAVWMTIAYGGLAILRNMMAAGAIHSTWGPFAARVFLAPFVLTGAQLLWWFSVYRPHGLEGRPIMIMMGIVFLMLLLVMWLNESMHGIRPGALNYLFFSYVAVAHLAYGFFGRR